MNSDQTLAELLPVILFTLQNQRTIISLYFSFIKLGNFALLECFNTACNATYDLENGYVEFSTNETYVNGSTEQAFCKEGYIINGDTNVTCLDDGTWSNYTLCLLLSKTFSMIIIYRIQNIYMY